MLMNNVDQISPAWTAVREKALPGFSFPRLVPQVRSAPLFFSSPSFRHHRHFRLMLREQFRLITPLLSLSLSLSLCFRLAIERYVTVPESAYSADSRRDDSSREDRGSISLRSPAADGIAAYTCTAYEIMLEARSDGRTDERTDGRRQLWRRAGVRVACQRISADSETRGTKGSLVP